jgi:hypothetical protein
MNYTLSEKPISDVPEQALLAARSWCDRGVSGRMRLNRVFGHNGFWFRLREEPPPPPVVIC